MKSVNNLTEVTKQLGRTYEKTLKKPYHHILYYIQTASVQYLLLESNHRAMEVLLPPLDLLSSLSFKV